MSPLVPLAWLSPPAQWLGLAGHEYIFVLRVPNMLETWFWCLYPCSWTWEIKRDHFQTPWVDLDGQHGHLVAILATENKLEWLNLYVLLKTWFWCLYPCYCTWEIQCEYLQTHHIDPSGQNSHLWPVWLLKINSNGQICSFGSEHARALILVSITMFLCMGNPMIPFPDTSDWSEWPKWPFVAIWPLKIS